MPDLILASASPRRRELLHALGVRFTVEPSYVPEEPRRGEDPAHFVERMACEKARAVAARHAGAWILAADTVVVADGQMLGKPSGAEDACRMLARLSGRAHHVLTGVALLAPDRTATSFVADSAVEFRPLSAAEIDAYVATGEPLDKAGAYAIQGGAGRFVRAVDGSYTNVVGLPIDEVRALLVRHVLMPP
jgi:septum formation protein